MKLDTGGRNSNVSNSYSSGYSQTNLTGTSIHICVLFCAHRAWRVRNPLMADSHIVCRSPAVPCRAAKGLGCVFPIWFTQCGRVWFTLAMPCHAHAMLRPCRSSQGHSRARPSRDGRALLWPWEERHGRSMAWAWHGMASVNQTRPHCVNQMGKTF